MSKYNVQYYFTSNLFSSKGKLASSWPHGILGTERRLKCTIRRHSVGLTLPVFLEDFESIACLASEQKLIESHVILTGCNDS